MQQGALPLAWPSRYDLHDYITDHSNNLAFDAVTTPDRWLTQTLLIVGDKSGGKTHLAHIFAHMTGAAFIHNNVQATNFIEGDYGYGVVDDIDVKLRDNLLDQKLVFHLVNVATQRPAKLLITASRPLNDWLTLPDLASRLFSSQIIHIGHPEEKVVSAAFQKLFAERGMIVDDKVVDFLATRSERSFRYIAAMVGMLDQLALEKSRRITVPLVQSIGLFN